MCKQCIFIIFLITVLSLDIVNSKKKKYKSDAAENEVLQKSEVIMKFPMYAMQMPPIITSRKRTNSKVDPRPVSCTSNNVTKSLNELRKKIKCVPRDTVVEISSPDGSVVTPNTVVVKRCGGMCSGSKKCISNGKTNAEFYVRTTHRKSTMVFCSKVSVPEDTECKCGCVQKKTCSSVQKFDSSLCKCICTNKDDYQDCMNKVDLNFKWSPKTCKCGCRNEKKCTTGTVWLRDKCKCVKV